MSEKINRVLLKYYPSYDWSYDGQTLKWGTNPINKPTEKELKDLILNLELEDVKELKIKELEEFYKSVQSVQVINGITFYMTLRGDWFNTLLPRVIEIGKLKKSNSYVRVLNIKNNLEYEGELPYDLLEDFYERCYDISIKNNRVKHKCMQIIKLNKNINELKEYKLFSRNLDEEDSTNNKFINIQTINLNGMINEYIEKSTNKEGVEYLKEKNYKIFQTLIDS